MKTFRWIVVVLAAVLLVWAGRCHRKGAGADSQEEVLTVEVKEGPLVVTVRASGEIQAQKANKIIPSIKRSALVEFMVTEGSRVTNGQVVARLNRDDINLRITDAENRVIEAETRMRTAQSDLEIQELDNQTNLKMAEQALEAARMQLEKYLQGDRPMSLRAAELKVETTHSTFLRSQKRFAEAGELLTQGFITEDQVEEERMSVETGRVDNETAEAELRILKAYGSPLEESNARNAVVKADTELEKITKASAVQLTNKQQALTAAQRQLERSTEDLRLLREDLKAYDVVSPSDGVVSYGDPDTSWRRGEMQVGMTLQSGQVLLTIPDMTMMRAVVDVPEAYVHKVAAGQPATLMVEALPGKPFMGTVERVAEVANPSGWLDASVKEYKVHIALTNGRELKPGFSCDAEIVVDSLPAALQVPVQAVFRDADRFFVYVAGPLGATRQTVQVGVASTTHVQVLEGLRAGQQVLLSEPVTAEKAP